MDVESGYMDGHGRREHSTRAPDRQGSWCLLVPLRPRRSEAAKGLRSRVDSSQILSRCDVGPGCGTLQTVFCYY